VCSGSRAEPTFCEENGGFNSEVAIHVVHEILVQFFVKSFERSGVYVRLDLSRGQRGIHLLAGVSALIARVLKMYLYSFSWLGL
jgi:hypothetical protein